MKTQSFQLHTHSQLHSPHQFTLSHTSTHSFPENTHVTFIPLSLTLRMGTRAKSQVSALRAQRERQFVIISERKKRGFSIPFLAYNSKFEDKVKIKEERQGPNKENLNERRKTSPEITLRGGARWPERRWRF